MILVIYKELECKVESLKYKKLEVMQLVIKPTRISPYEVFQSWLINTVYHLLVKKNESEGREAYWLSSPEKGGGGGLIADLRYYN